MNMTLIWQKARAQLSSELITLSLILQESLVSNLVDS